MCGIVGKFLFDRHGVVGTGEIQRMCDTIVHRGPDDEGVFACGPIGVGMRRLSIIDLAGGHQPMRTDDGVFTIVYNGEIYNYKDVRARLESEGVRFKTQSDTECILHGYAKYGARCLQMLNGMFAIAIWDANRRELFVARDRVGIKPLYWRQDESGISFASEIKALLTDPSASRSLDLDAFKYFLRYGYVSSPATLLRGIRQLPPAHYFIASESGVRVQRYWSLPSPGSGSPMSDEAQKERVYDLVKQAVDRQLVSDVPLGAFLSGGLDSGSMVHLMSEVTGAAVSTYSIGFSGVDTFHNELDDAKFVAERYGTNHHEIIVRPDAASLIPRLVDHLDQPLADSSFVVTYLVSALARETVKVIISGVGGDELFGGYRRYLGPYLGQYYQAVPGPVRAAMTTASSWLPVDRGSAAKNYFRLARSFVTTHGLPAYERYDAAVQLLSPEDAGALSPDLPGGESALTALRHECFDAVPADDPLSQMLRLDFHTSLVDSLLQLTDKMSMATSLEARVPLLDHELVEAVTTLPSSSKIRRGKLRFIQKKSMEGRLPDQVLRKKKRGFGCPVGAWFRTDLRPLVRDTLSRDALRRRGLFDPERVQTIISEHEEFRQDRTDLLLALLTFQLWADQWRITS
jgi:asparagine synthase (glutamine-hydrolysing)